MNLTELTGAATTLRQIGAQIAALRGGFLVARDIAFSRQCNDIGLLVSDLLERRRLMPARAALKLFVPQS